MRDKRLLFSQNRNILYARSLRKKARIVIVILAKKRGEDNVDSGHRKRP